jgi:uncharacterized repeat protein (TIGR01451 family)
MTLIQRLMSTRRRAWNTLLSLGLALLSLCLFLELLDSPPQAVQALGPAATWEFPGPCGATLQACIDNATDGDTVVVVASCQASGLAIDKPLTLDGGGLLGVQGASPALTITADNVTVSDAAFTGTAGSPVILVRSASTTTLQAITVTNGGTAGVLITGTSSSGHLISSSTIYSNSGPGIHLAVTTTLRLLDSDILHNTVADGRGGGLCSDQLGTLLHVEGGLFQGNSVSGTISLEYTGFGGGLFVAGRATLSGTRLISNTSSVAGGGIAVIDYAALNGVQFIDNVSRWGGGFYQDAFKAGGVDATNSRFERNVASFIGGGLNVWGSTRLTETWLISNTALTSGGGIYGTDDMLVIGGRVERNVAVQENGGGLRNWYDMTLSGTQVLSNTAGQRGGGLYQAGTSSSVHVIGGRFEANVATQLDGGGLYVRGNMVLAAAWAVNNTAGECGGGLYVEGGADVVNSVLAANGAHWGSGLYLKGSLGQQTLRHLTIASPTVGSGSAVFVAGGTVSITNTIIASYTIGISQTGGVASEDYNLFFGNTVSQTSSAGTLSAGANSLDGLDPRFVDPIAGDYHVDPTSAAIDAGTNVGVLWDIDGDPRPTGSGYDIGADERPGASLHLHKTARPLALNPGQTITYTILVANPGVEDATNVILTDTLPAQHRPVTVESSQNSCTSGSDWGAQIVCTVGDLVAGSTAHITITAEVTTTLAGPIYPVRNIVQARGDNVANETHVDTYMHDCHIRVNGDLPEYTEVQAAVDAADGGDTVMVAGTCSGVNERGGVAQVVYIDKAITLRGGYTTTNWTTPYPITQPTTLEALGQGRVLYLTGDISPTVEGFHITGGSANGLGGYPVAGNDAGGGIYIGSTTATVVSSRIFGNTAGYGGGLYSNSDVVSVSGSLFEHNVAISGGGGLYVSDSAVLIETQVISNTARAGAGLYQYGYYKQVDVTGGLFENNVANGASAFDGGGGLYVAGGANLSGTQLVENTSEWTGGGLHARRSAQLTGVQVISNTADHSGGGLYVSGNAVLTSTVMVSNTAGKYGGGLRVVGDVFATGSRFERNAAMQYDGGGLYVYGSAVLVETQVMSNTTVDDGGGLCVRESAALSETRVISNTAGGHGGGLYVGGSAALTETQVVSNTAGGHGGGLYQADDNGQVRVIGGHFERNVAGYSGGGLFVGGATSTGTKVVSNTAGSNGGGLYVNGNSASLSGMQVISNTAGSSGGGLYVSEYVTESMNVVDCHFEHNVATYYGGGLYVWDSVLLIGTQVVSNIAGGSGGGLFQYGTAGQVDVSGSCFEDNVATAFSGGGLYVRGSAEMSGTQVVSNTAGHNGGGLYQYGTAGRVDVTDGYFEHNVATLFSGGGLYIEGSAVLSGTQVISNTAGWYGGGLYQQESTGRVDVTGSYFEHNTATYSGGGLYVGGSATLTETQTSKNAAGWSGGGLYQDRTDGWVDVAGGCFKHNVATQFYGGGLRVGGSASLSGTQVISNTAGTRGGGLNVEGNASLSGTQVISNTAVVQGGGLFVAGDVDVTSSRIERNVALTGYGGGLFAASDAQLSGTEIISNVAKGSGGGMSGDGNVNVTGCRFASNVAGQGDGGGLTAGSAALTGTEIVSNKAGRDGGGLYIWSDMALTGTQVVSNVAGQRGGGLCGDQAVKAVNSLFAANIADDGAGLYLRGDFGSQTLCNLTIVHPAAGSGEAIYVYNGTVNITNTIISNYSIGIYQRGGMLNEDYNLYFGNGTPIVSTGGTLVTGTHSLYDQDPQFVDPVGGDYHLMDGSPAIDAGTPHGAPPFDIDGDPRPQGDGYDIGADEYVGERLVYLPLVVRDY